MNFKSIIPKTQEECFSLLSKSVKGICISERRDLLTSLSINEIMIPTVFTPNGDGKNDVYYISIPEPKNFEMMVFDKGKKKNKIISFSFYYKTREEICIKEYDWRDISSNIKTTSSCKLINVNFFDISNKVESIDFFLEKLNQVN